MEQRYLQKMSQNEKDVMSCDDPVSIDYSIPLECIDATKTWGASSTLVDECVEAARFPCFWISSKDYVLPMAAATERDIREYAYETVCRSARNIVAIFSLKSNHHVFGDRPYVFVIANISVEEVITRISRVMNLKVFL